MASNRHLGRVIALQTLYEQEFRRDAGDASFDTAEILQRNISRYREMVDDLTFIEALVNGISAQTAYLDKTLQPVAPEWPIDQIARMDRIILHIGLFELENEPDVPPKVVINEAVELAKAFGGDNSSKFVNGVLGTLLRQREVSAALDSDTDDQQTTSEAESSAKVTPTVKRNKPITPRKAHK